MLRYAERDCDLPDPPSSTDAAGVANPQPAASLPRPDIRKVRVCAGARVAISPYLIHHDSRFFEHPEEYLPLRHSRKQRAAGSWQSEACSTSTGCAQDMQRSASASNGRACLPSENTTSVVLAADASCVHDPAPVQIAFGAGSFRCPGRNFALRHLRLAVATLLTAYDIQLLTDSAASPCSDTRRAQTWSARQGWVPRWLSRSSLPGTHVCARGVTSGDRHARLPQFRSQLLVGVKRPVGALLVQCRRRSDDAVK